MTRAVTTLAVVGSDVPATVARVEAVMQRLEEVSSALLQGTALGPEESQSIAPPVLDADDPAEYQIRRMERQMSVLERTARQLIER
jgi:hypothetical protein